MAEVKVLEDKLGEEGELALVEEIDVGADNFLYKEGEAMYFNSGKPSPHLNVKMSSHEIANSVRERRCSSEDNDGPLDCLVHTTRTDM